MEQDQFTHEIIELRERVTRNESSIINLIQEQTAIDNLVNSVHELAIAIKEISIQTQGFDKRLGCIEEEKRDKSKYIWTLVVSATFGGTLTFVVTTFLKEILK